MGEDPTPAAITEMMRELWEERGALIGETYEISPCPYTQEELSQLRDHGRRPAFLPAGLATQESRHKLGSMFPLMKCFSVVEDNAVTNDQDHSGWFDYDVAIEAPFGGTNADELISQVLDDGQQLMSLNQYIVTSQDSKVLTGQYLDELRSWTRVGSRMNGRMVPVRFEGPVQDMSIGDEISVDGSLLTAYDVKEYVSVPFCGGRGFRRPASLNDRPARRHEIIWSRGSACVPELDLDAEWERQASLLVDAGVPAELGLSVEEYLASLPRFAPQPSQYMGRLDVPLLVETRVPWKRLAAMVDMTVAPSARPIDDVLADERFAAPVGAYTSWFNDWGQGFVTALTPIAARAQLADDEIGAAAHEGIAMALAHPQVFENGRFWDLIGSLLVDSKFEVEMDGYDVPERTMAIYNWHGRPELAGNMHQVAVDVFRPLIRGTEVMTK